MKFPYSPTAFVSLSAGLLTLLPSASAQVRFYGIGDLPGGAVYSEVRDVTKVNGVIYAVGTSAAFATAATGDTAVVWTSTGGLRAQPNLVSTTGAGPFIAASAITPNGAFIASRARSSATTNARSAVRVTTSNLALLDLGTLPGFSVSAANAISSDGSILYGFAQYNTSGAQRAVRFNASDRSIQTLPILTAGHDASAPAARGTSADGSVMVGETWNSATGGGGGPGSRAFRFTSGAAPGAGITEIPLLPGGTWNTPLAVSPNGALTLARGNSATSPQGELYLVASAGGAITPLDSPNGALGPTNVGGITADGAVAVVNFNAGPSQSIGYLRNARGWHEFQTIARQAGVNLAGWQLDTPVGISPDGTLVWGGGTHNGNREGWVMEFPAGALAAYTEPATYSTPGRDIVGAWTMGNPGVEGAAVLVFFANGYYFHIQDATSTEQAQGGADGFERGQYTWDAATGAFTSRSLLDNNGDIGLSPGNALTTVTIAGDTMTAKATDGTYTLTRVTGSSPIVGAFGVGNVHDGSRVAVFLPSGHYFHAEDGQADQNGRDGIERGTYQWNPTSGALTVSVALDTNGEWGLSHSRQPLIIQPAADGATVREGSEPVEVVARVRAASVLLPTLTAQPVAVSVVAGQRAGFTVAVTGTAPFAYQWRKDGVNIAGATAAAYGIAAAKVEDAGNYTCVVTNSVGSVTSEPAALTVTRNFAGTYFGTLRDGRGEWGMIVLPDGTGTFIAFVNNPRSGMVLPVRIAADGTFRVAGQLVSAQGGPGWLDGRAVAAATTPVTLSGTIRETSVGGTIEGPNIGFGGTPDAPGGPTTAVSGLYQATGAGGTTTYTVVGTDRRVVALTIGATQVSGGLGTVGTDGKFTVTTSDNTTINGTVTSTGTLTGTVPGATGGTVAVAGSTVEAVGPPVIATPPRAQSAVAGGVVTLTIEARGAPLTYQWKKDGRDIAGATQATYAIAAAQTTDAAEYSCVVTNGAGSVTSAPAALAVRPYNAGRLVNLSILTDIPAAGEDFTLGTVIGGEGTVGAKPLLVRAAGPSLGALGVGGVIADPALEVYFGTIKTGENDNWGGTPTLSSAFTQLGAFPYTSGSSRDAAIFNPSVAPGNNSVRVFGVGGATGRVIAELYEATPLASYALTTPRLVNVSVFKEVGNGFTLGFVINGDSSATVLVRAIGPGLAGVGVTSGTLRDPKLTLFAGSSPIDGNDNWGGVPALVSAIGKVGAFAVPVDSRDAVVLATLPPGSYSVEVASVDGTGGRVIAEVYEIR